MYPNTSVNHTGSAYKAWAITPNDTTDFATPTRMITIGGEGEVSFLGVDGVVSTTGVLPVGNYPILCRRIRATGTTATKITGWT